MKNQSSILKHIDVTRTTNTTLDVLLEYRIDDYWNVDGDRELSNASTGFTRFTILMQDLMTDVYGPAGG